jgi:cytochrome bd-type quinol oxidase subunit 1
MHFPWWYVSHATAPMLIAAISVIHMLVAHYAVGGGLFLAVETTHAYRTQDRDYLAYLKRHAKFFVLLTVAFGAITGVGIWWTIGLASPLATRVLIHTFVFAWATEYVFFIVEIVSACIFYYYWGRLPEKTHTIIVWIYGVSAWASLAIIAAITAFMLDPGNWRADHQFWSALLNRQALPQIIARTGGALLLSSLYVYLHAAIVIKDTRLHKLIELRSTRPALLGAVLITLGGCLWYAFLPPSAQAVLDAAPVLNVMMALLFVATGIVFVLLYLGPYRNPGWIQSPGFAAALLAFGVIGMSAGEFIREAVRKPYICYNVVLGSQMLVDEVAEVQKNGFLESGKWTKAHVRANYPQVMSADGHIDGPRLLALPRTDQIALGGVIFQYHCNNCHAIEQGYSPVAPMVQGWTSGMIRSVVHAPDRTRLEMPPWTGTPEEAELLVAYLSDLSPPRPAGMLPERSKTGER